MLYTKGCHNEAAKAKISAPFRRQTCGTSTNCLNLRSVSDTFENRVPNRIDLQSDLPVSPEHTRRAPGAHRSNEERPGAPGGITESIHHRSHQMNPSTLAPKPDPVPMLDPAPEIFNPTSRSPRSTQKHTRSAAGAQQEQPGAPEDPSIHRPIHQPRPGQDCNVSSNEDEGKNFQ